MTNTRLPHAFLFVMPPDGRKARGKTPASTFVFHAGPTAVEIHRVGDTAAAATALDTAEHRAILRQIAGLFVGSLPAPILTRVAPDDVALLCQVRQVVNQALGDACEPS